MVSSPLGESSFPLAERPRLRPVDASPLHYQGQPGLILRDTSDRDLAPLFVSRDAVRILELLDGNRSLAAIARAAALRGVPASEAHVRQLLTQLDRAGYLEGPRAAFRHQQRRDAFLARSIRPAIFAGGAYPDLPELPRFLEDNFSGPGGPGALPRRPRLPDAAPLRALIAPHIDLHRGAPTYSWAYRALAEAAPADVYVILGTCHTPIVGHVAATRKPYDTPFGAVPTDVRFLEALGREYGRDLFAGEFSHAGEHAIEFQAVYLRWLGLAGGDTGATIVPILCDSLHSMVRDERSPRDVPVVDDLLGALRRTVEADGRRVTYIAAVDLAHVGTRFGDPWEVSPDRAEQIGEADREMLERICAADAEGYYRQVMRDHDARRICGFTPLYLVTALMEAERRRGEVLRYEQWVDDDRSSSVTFVSAAFF